LVEKFGYFDNNTNKVENPIPIVDAMNKEWNKLYAAITLNHVGKIDSKEESFEINLSITAMWAVNL
jgi:hypothetical protein